MLLQSVHVIQFVNTVEKGKKATLYTTEIGDGEHSWTVNIRYSKFHEFHQALLKTDRSVMGKLPFPTKDLFSNQSPEYRQKELDKFVSQLRQEVQSLSMAAQVAFYELLEVPQHEFHAKQVNTARSNQPEETVEDDVSEKRVSKQSISSTTTTELDDDNQHETLSDATPSEHHHMELLSPVASSRSGSPRHDLPSEAETVDLTQANNDHGVTPIGEAFDLHATNESHGELLRPSSPAIQHIDDIGGEPSDDAVVSAPVRSAMVETIVDTTVTTTFEAPSLLFQLVEAFPTTIPMRSLHAWEASEQKQEALDAHQCRYLITRTFRVLYPSLFL